MKIKFIKKKPTEGSRSLKLFEARLALDNTRQKVSAIQKPRIVLLGSRKINKKLKADGGI